MNRIEHFNRCTGLIFGELYRSFPLRADVTSDVLPAEIFDDIDEDDFDGAFERLVVFQKTAQWLVQAGYIWAEDVRDSGLHSAVLAPKGLEVLKAVPSSLASERSLGEQIQHVTSKGAYALLSKSVDAALAAGVRLATTGTI